MRNLHKSSNYNNQIRYRQLLILILSAGVFFGVSTEIFAQRKKINNAAQKVRSSKMKTITAAANADKNGVSSKPMAAEVGSKSDGRIFFTNNNEKPPLLTMVVGQVTTIKGYEPALQYKTDNAGLNISESNELSDNYYLYIIPLEPGIRRNLVIEFKSGKVEFEIESIEVPKGSTAKFTREVEIRASRKTEDQNQLNDTVKNLQTELDQKNERIKSFPDLLAAAADEAQQRELSAQAEILLKWTDKDKGNLVTGKNDLWKITELFSRSQTIKSEDQSDIDNDGEINKPAKNIYIRRRIRVFGVKYKGTAPVGNILEIKSGNGRSTFYMTEKQFPGNLMQKGFTVVRDKELKIVVIESEKVTGENTAPLSGNLLFIGADGIVEF